MKTFKRQRKLAELKAICDKPGFQLDARQFDQGSDYVSLDFTTKDGVPGHAIVSMFNGRFFGSLAIGTEFSSNNDQYDDEEWFIDLMEMIYTNDEPS